MLYDIHYRKRNEKTEVYFSYKEQGITKRYSKGGFNTKKEAKQHALEKILEIKQNGKLKKEVKKTLNEVFDEFISVAPSEYQENTVRTMYYCKSYFEDTIGKMRITEIRHKDLQQFFDSRKDKGIEQNKKIRKALRNVFVHARRNEYINNNPLQDVKVRGLEIHREEPQPISEENLERLIEELKKVNDFKRDSYIIAIYLGHYLALRIEEAFALEKKDFDLDKGTVSINKKIVYGSLKTKDIYASNQLKSKSSYATMPLNEVLISILDEWFKINPYEKVVCNENGDYINPNVFGNDTRKISKSLGFHFNFHSLRHSVATNCFKNGIAPKEAQIYLRHASFDTTLSIYTHLKDEDKKSIQNRLFEQKRDKIVTNPFIKKETLN